MPVHTNRNVGVRLPSQAKSQATLRWSTPTRFLIFSHTSALLSHTCTCTSRWIVPRRAITLLFPPSTITPFGRHDHVELSRCVGHSRCRPLSNPETDTRAIFNEAKSVSTTLENTRTHSQASPPFTFSVYSVATNVCISVSED